MLRVAAFVVLVLAVWLALRWLVLFLERREVDWTGVAFAAGFVALAFWLRSATGLG